MRSAGTTVVIAAIGVGLSGPAHAGDKEALIESAMSAAPAAVSDRATIRDTEGNVLQKGENGWTCYPEMPASGPMCNDAQWEAMMAAYMKKQPITPTKFGVSYMLAGDGGSPGVSNKDPFATEPTDDNDWVKEGPHMMLILPDPAMLEGISTDPADPVYVMWKGTPYAHIMVRINEKE